MNIACRGCKFAQEDCIDFGDCDVPTRHCIWPLDEMPDEYSTPLEMPEVLAHAMDWFETNKASPHWCPLEDLS